MSFCFLEVATGCNRLKFSFHSIRHFLGKKTFNQNLWNSRHFLDSFRRRFKEIQPNGT